MIRLLAPAGRQNVQGVCVYPEVIALRVAVKMKTYAITSDLCNGEKAEEGRMLGVDALKSHADLEGVSARWKRLVRKINKNEK